MFLEVGGEVGEELVAQGIEVGGEEVEGFMAIAEPPFAGGGVEDEAVGFDEGEGGGVGAVFAGREGEGEVVFGAVHEEGGGGFAGAGRAGRRGGSGGGGWAGGGGGRWRGGAFEVFADAAQEGTDPEEGFVGGGEEGEDGERMEGGDEFGELGAVKLDKRRGLRGSAAETLKGGEAGEESGVEGGGGVESHLHGDSVALSGGGEVGWEKEANHVVATTVGGREDEARENLRE